MRRLDPVTRLDLSAIAKGHAADVVSATLVGLGVVDHTVEVGGEIRVSGLRGDGEPWRIGVAYPVGDGSGPVEIRVLSGGIATSGDYANELEIAGERFAHTIDPRSGVPADSDLIAATVVASTAMHADAFATALMVMGSAEALEWCERRGVAALLAVEVDRSSVRYAVSTAMQAYLKDSVSAE